MRLNRQWIRPRSEEALKKDTSPIPLRSTAKGYDGNVPISAY